MNLNIIRNGISVEKYVILLAGFDVLFLAIIKM